MDSTFVSLLGRMVLINIVPFFLVFHLVIRRKKQVQRQTMTELALIAGEIKAIGILGYFMILSIFFYSIPVLRHLHRDEPFYMVYLVPPDNTTVFLIAFVCYALVVIGIYLKYKRRWAYGLALFIFDILLIHSFFTILEIGGVCIVPIVIFSYFLYRLTRPSLKQELNSKNAA